ncbi:MAG: ABC transporter transmembrane domain-containing protein, partial [bacterium]
MTSDSKTTLRRALRKNVQGHFFKIVFWTVLAVAAEMLAIDFASMFLQYAATGTVGQTLLLETTRFGMDERSGFVGPALLIQASGMVFCLLVAILLAQVTERLTRHAELLIATDLRTRLFRETHRTSGQLITPSAMGETMALIETAAIRYGQVVAGQFRHKRLVVIRNIALLGMMSIIRWDLALMIAAGAALVSLLKFYHSRRVKSAEQNESATEKLITNAFREELRESHQARVIGSPQGKGRPSDNWIETLEERDRTISENQANRQMAMRLARLGVICVVVSAIALNSMGQPMGPASLLALLSIACGGMILRAISESGRKPLGSEDQWLDPIHQTLHGSVRIWDVTDAKTMHACQQKIVARALPMGISPADPRSTRKF